MKKQRKLSHLPLLRFTSVIIVLVALESLICISLWIAGGDTLYMENSVKEFSFLHSTFDLACLSAVRCLILVACFYYLEYYSLLQVSVGQHDLQRSSNRMARLCQILIFIVSGVSMIYAVVKGALIIQSIVRGTWNNVDQETTMHTTYKVLCIVAVIFPAIEILFCLLSSWCLRRMIHTRRLRLLVNLEGGDEKPIKKKPDIKRILLLAKPVNIIILFFIDLMLVCYIGVSYVAFWDHLLGDIFNFPFSSPILLWKSDQLCSTRSE